MKKFVTVLFLLSFLSMFAQITVQLSSTQPLYNYMGMNCFNPEDPTNQPIFLNAVLSGSYTEPFKIKIQLSWGDATALVWKTPINPSLPLYLTNQDIINNSPDIDGDYDDFVDEIESILLDTGKMPDGDYVIQLQVFTLDGDPLSEQRSLVFSIQSPLAIDLLTPGAPFGLSLVQIGTQYPEFLWISNFDEYNLYVYEIDESITSPEDLESMDPHFETVVYSNIFGYPPGATNSLNPGSTYAWQITAETVTPITNQNVTMKSSFYVFQVAQDSSMPPIDPVVLQNLINQFMATGSGVQELLGLLQNGYTVQTITWQGQEITLEELMAILNSGQYTPSE